MVARRDLNAPPAQQLADVVARLRDEQAQARTGAAGVSDLGTNGDAIWTDADGVSRSVRQLPVEIADLSQQLADGIATAGLFNTVSTSAPGASATEYPDGAFWTVVEIGPPMVEVDRWQWVDGGWTQVGLDAGRLVAGTVDAGLIDAVGLAARMVTAGLIRTAESGHRVVIDSSGIAMYGVDADGADYEMVRIGPAGDNLITAGDTTISPAGVRATAGSFDDLTVGGNSLADILERMPRGMRAWGALTTDSQLDSDTGNYARRGELQTTLEPNRLYRIALSSHYITTSYGTNTTAVEELRYSFDATPIFEQLNPGAGNYRGVQYRHLITTGNAYASPGMEFMLNTGNWSGERIFWLMWLLRPEHGTAAIRVLARSDYAPILSIEDMGPSQPSIMKRWNDGNGGGSQDTTPVVVRRTDTWGAGGYGGDTKNGTVYQGTYSSYGNRYGGWIFSSAMRSALSGSTIEKFEVYLENAHWYYGSGGTARLVPNDGSYKGVNFGNTSVESPNWPRYAGRWVTIPSSWYPYIANGTYKGVSTYATSSRLLYYGQFKGAPTKFRATYRK